MRRIDEITNSEDMIDIRDVIARFEYLEEQRKPWVAGCNMPGYMPDSEPSSFESWEDARDAIVHDLEEALELAAYDDNGNLLAGDVSDEATDLKSAIERLNAATDEAEYGETIGNWHYWIAANSEPFEDKDEASEYALLQELLSDLAGYGGDEQWRGDWYPISLIRDSYFVQAMQELCEDIGDFPKGVPDYFVIDWEATARNLRVDYSSVEFDGVTYWYR